MSIEKKFETLDKKLYCQQITPDQFCARNNSEWENMWNRICPAYLADSPLPKIDFDKEMVLGVFLGTKPSSGYNIEILHLLEKDNCLEVYVKETKPTFGFFYASVLTQPYHIIKTDKVDKDIKLVR